MNLSLPKILSATASLVILAICLILLVTSIRYRLEVKNNRIHQEASAQISQWQQLELDALQHITYRKARLYETDEMAVQHLQQSRNKLELLLQTLAAKKNLATQQQTQTDTLNLLLHALLTPSIVETAASKDESSRLLSQQAAEIQTSIAQLVAREKARLIEIDKQNTKWGMLLQGILFILLGSILVFSIYIIKKVRTGVARQKLNEQKFSALLDAAPDATVIVDEKGHIQLVNQQMVNLFGYSREEIIGQPVELLIPPDLRSKHMNHRAGFVADSRVRPMGMGIELRAIRKNGSNFPVEISLSPIQTVQGLLVSASIRDISERKKLEEKFKSLLDSAPDATVIVNDAGIIQMINHQTETLFGYTKAELVGEAVELLIPADLRSKHVKHRGNFIKAAKVRTMGAGIELNAVKKNGVRFPVEISLSPISTEEGMLVSASVRDISARKVLEDELKKSNSELEAFTYSVSHDLRAPLRGIIGFTAILEEDYANKLDEEARRITAVIKSNTLKMGHLIDDLLAFSRMGKKEISKTQVQSNKLVAEILVELKQQQASYRQVSWTVAALPAVYADLITLRQVWINLLSNAVKYSGKVQEPAIEIGSYYQDQDIIFYVKDNGVGFDEQYKDKLFKVFQRLHSAEEFEGTGVGLAVVEKIISRHGGKVWATGKPDAGACFYFSLPNQISEPEIIPHEPQFS